MAQLSMYTTLEFESQLRRFMMRQGLARRSEAIRVAVKEALESSPPRTPRTDLRAWRDKVLDRDRHCPQFHDGEQI